MTARVTAIAAALLMLTACEARRPDADVGAPPPLGGLAEEAAVDRFYGEAGRGTRADDAFPVALPAHPGTRLIASIRQQGMGHVRTYLAPEEPDAMLAFYLDRLRAEGWRIDFDGPAEGMPMISLAREEQRLRISVERSGRGSIVHLAAPPGR